MGTIHGYPISPFLFFLHFLISVQTSNRMIENSQAHPSHLEISLTLANILWVFRVPTDQSLLSVFVKGAQAYR